MKGVWNVRATPFSEECQSVFFHLSAHCLDFRDEHCILIQISTFQPWYKPTAHYLPCTKQPTDKVSAYLMNAVELLAAEELDLPQVSMQRKTELKAEWILEMAKIFRNKTKIEKDFNVALCLQDMQANTSSNTSFIRWWCVSVRLNDLPTGWTHIN